MYRWNLPANIEWARSRDIAGSLSLREWCRHLENRVRDAEAALAIRQRAADFADEPDKQGGEPAPQADEAKATKSPVPVSIRWEGRRRG
jgi:hypothetical protein